MITYKTISVPFFSILEIAMEIKTFVEVFSNVNKVTKWEKFVLRNVNMAFA